MTDQEESDQTRDVYAHFGLALYLAQCLEQSIFQHLLFVDHFPRALAAHKTHEEWIGAFDAYEARELGQTLGKLIRRWKEVGQPTDVIEGKLKEALNYRNWLAHGYFADRATSFVTPQGREGMLDELRSMQAIFRDAAELIDEATRPIAQRFGLTEDVIEKLVSELLSRGDASNKPANGHPRAPN